MTTQWNCRTLTKRFTLSTKHIGVRVGNFLNVQRTSCPNFPNLPEKLLSDKHSPCKLSVDIGTLCFYLPCCQRLENGKFGTSNLVLNNPSEKSTLGCARTWPEASWLSILVGLPHSFEVFHSHCSCCRQQGSSDLAEVDLKLLPSLKTYMWYSVT